MIHLLRKTNSKNVYSREELTLSKNSNFSIADSPCSSSCKFFMWFVNFENWQKLAILYKMYKLIYMLFLSKPEILMKEVLYIE